jgi:hypothetical protein
MVHASLPRRVGAMEIVGALLLAAIVLFWWVFSRTAQSEGPTGS